MEEHINMAKKKDNLEWYHCINTMDSWKLNGVFNLARCLMEKIHWKEQFSAKGEIQLCRKSNCAFTAKEWLVLGRNNGSKRQGISKSDPDRKMWNQSEGSWEQRIYRTSILSYLLLSWKQTCISATNTISKASHTKQDYSISFTQKGLYPEGKQLLASFHQNET